MKFNKVRILSFSMIFWIVLIGVVSSQKIVHTGEPAVSIQDMLADRERYDRQYVTTYPLTIKIVSTDSFYASDRYDRNKYIRVEFARGHGISQADFYRYIKHDRVIVGGLFRNTDGGTLYAWEFLSIPK